MKITLSILCCCLLLVTACNTSRKVSDSTTVASSDSVEEQAEQVVNKVDYRDRIIYKRDTIIRVVERKVVDTITVKEQELPRIKDGTPQAVKRNKRSNSVEAWLTILPNGDIEYGCRADSLLIEVDNLVSEKEVWHSKYDSLALLIKKQVSTSNTEREVVIEKRKTWWGKYGKWIIGILIIVVIAIILQAVKMIKPWKG